MTAQRHERTSVRQSRLGSGRHVCGEDAVGAWVQVPADSVVAHEHRTVLSDASLDVMPGPLGTLVEMNVVHAATGPLGSGLAPDWSV